MSRQESGNGQSRSDEGSSRSARILWIVFIAATLGVALAGRLYFDAQSRDLLARQGEALSAVRDLKIGQLIEWRANRLEDGTFIATDPALRDEVDRWVADPNDVAAAETLRQWMKVTTETKGYSGVAIMSPDGSRWLSTSADSLPDSPERAEAEKARGSTEATLTDFFLDPATSQPRLDVVAPLVGGSEKTRAVVVLNRDPRNFLYPMLQKWPSPSKSSETLLVRRDNGGVLYLNNLRFQTNAALRSKLPLSNRKLLAVQAVEGSAHTAEGIDYRGTPVFGAVGRVGDTPWYVVAKIDRAEAFSGLARSQWLISIAAIVLTALIGMGLAFAWRQRTIEYYRKQLETERSEALLSQQYNLLTRYASDAVILADEQLRIIQANERAIALYGYTEDELALLTLDSLLAPDVDGLTTSMAAALIGDSGELIEVRQRRADGSVIDAEMTTQAMVIDDQILYLTITRDVTARKATERALEESRMLLESVIGSTPDAIYVKDPAGRYLLFNHGAELVTGKNAPDVLGRDDTFLFPAEEAKTVMDGDRAVMDGGVAVNYDEHVTASDGTIHHFSSTKGPLFDHNGNVRGLFGFARDITARKTAEDDLVRTTAFLENLLDYANAPIVVWDSDLNITRFNHACERLTRRGADEVVGKHLRVLFPDESVDDSLLQIARTAQGVYWEAVEVPILRADGQVRIAVWNSANIYDAEKRLVATIAQGTDVTESRATERKLRDSELRFRSIVDCSPTAIYLYHLESDDRLVLTAANPASDVIIGIDHSTLLGKTIEEAFPNLVQTEIPDMYRAIARGELPPRTFEIPYGDNRFSGYYLVTVFQTGPDLVAVDFLDISDRKRAEEELAARSEDLQRSNAELERFAYVASHDLQEPLRMVASYTQLLQRRYEGRLDADADEFIGYAVDGANRMQRLINELLAYSRVGSQGVEFVEADLEQVFGEVMKALSVSITESEAVIRHEPLPTVACDPTQIGQVFQNLIANAIKFRGEDAPLIYVGVESTEAEWVFSVQDNGLGIEPEYFERIFVIFQRLQSRADYPGTGMGLAICKRIVERHGGRTWVESTPGQGSTFYFTLPKRGESQHVV